MLIPILLLLQKPADGLQRFRDFVSRSKSYSVQLVAHSENIPVPGKGSMFVVQPSSFRVAMDWGKYDYTYVKAPTQSVDYERFSKTYQEYPMTPGLRLAPTEFSSFQADSIPLPPLMGDLKALAGGTEYKLSAHDKDTETYTATLSGGSGGAISAVIAADGRLLRFDYLIISMKGRIHRVFDFSNYVFAKIPPETFSTVPPLGFTSYQFPYPEPSVSVGDTLRLGRWQSREGAMNIDAAVRGKLVIVRSPDSPPADALVAYLAHHKPPVASVVVSLGTSGGAFWSPSPKVATDLAAMGTPLLILLGPDNKIKALWLGFDPDDASNLVAEITKAVKVKANK